ncbi:LytR C-terminal domain-containing protein [Demequina sp.]|uniref:LytR C-terminal domain-containing protein n=1 Tax=Demequina sp. TaxID=2050685 RepID=UPI003D0FAC5E
MTASGTPHDSRRRAVRRHRRERQVLVFGIILIIIAAIVFISMGVYKGTIRGPFNASFVTPQAEFTSSVTTPCPPSGSMPLDNSEVAVRVLNGTDTPGLAGTALNDLENRGFVPLAATNWSREYEGTARIMFGETGLQKAYTLARQFPATEMVLDTRDNATVDVVLGDEFTSIVDPLDPQLDEDVPLTATVECLPMSQIEPEPAPRIYPADPLAPKSTPTPSPSPSEDE